jgi:hypothetical protein
MKYGVCLFFSSFIVLAPSTVSLRYQLESSGSLGPRHTLLTFLCLLYSYPASQFHAMILKVHLQEIFDFCFFYQKPPLSPLIHTLNLF